MNIVFTEEKRERNVSIDVLRGVAIIAVIVGHLNHFFEYESMIMKIIYSFHMPLFCIVSGYIFGEKPREFNIQFFQQKIRTQMVPYFVFAFLSMFLVLPDPNKATVGYIVDIFYGCGINGLQYNIALWFLPMFFCASVIFSVLYTISLRWFSDKQVLMFCVFAVIASMGGYYIMRSYNPRMWNFEVALFVQIFMIGGFLFQRIEKTKFLSEENKKSVFVVCMIATIVWMMAIVIMVV